MYGNNEANQDRCKYHADEKYAYIPRFEISAHAGSGRFPDHEEINGTHAYRRSWLTKHKLFAEHLVVIEVDGDSMQPTICDGDLILINTAACTIKSGNVYAFKTQDGVRIKRLHKQMDGRLLITSDSPNKIEFPDEYLTELALPDIIGAVVHRSGGV